ncbi:hypothetical protein SO802_003904 [Lithocarpus litseifolius]
MRTQKLDQRRRKTNKKHEDPKKPNKKHEETTNLDVPSPNLTLSQSPLHNPNQHPAIFSHKQTTKTLITGHDLIIGTTHHRPRSDCRRHPSPASPPPSTQHTDSQLPSIPSVVIIFARKRFLLSVKQGWRWKDNKKAKMDVDSQPTMEETILVGDDLMMGPPSPLIPPEIASHVLEGVDLCDGILRNLFLCLQINDIEPFCQDEIAVYRQCAEKRDKELRQRLQDSEHKLGLSMPLDEAKERAAQLESEVTSLERRLILASGIEGMEGFRQRWSLHGRLTDTKRRLESLKQGMENKIKDEPVGGSTAKRWSFW